jgi:hypothetical protein
MVSLRDRRDEASGVAGRPVVGHGFRWDTVMVFGSFDFLPLLTDTSICRPMQGLARLEGEEAVEERAVAAQSDP